jgi:ribosomal protein S18 acetylase RimI-like enzyme
MPHEFDLPFPHYRCATCGKDLPLGEARMTVTCGDHNQGERPQYEVRRATEADRAEIETICDRALGETIVDAFGKTFDVLTSVNFVAELEGHMMGLLSVAIHEGEAAIVFLSVYPEHQGTGVGSSLLKAAAAFASERGLSFLRVSTTNDDIPLLYFYQRHGFAIYDVAVGEVADRFGSATPGFSSIPVRDEIRMRRCV